MTERTVCRKSRSKSSPPPRVKRILQTDEEIGKMANPVTADIGRYNTQYSTGQVGSQYAYHHEEDGTSFQLVDTTKPQKSAHLRASNQKEPEKRIQAGYLPPSGKGATNREITQRQRYDPRNQAPTKQRQPSVQIRPDWEVVEEMDFPRLQKLTFPGVGDGEDIPNERYGTLEYYDKTYDRLTAKNEKPLQRINRFFYTITTTDDPVIEKLASTNPEFTVFGTDALIATLMCATRSVYSWDIIVHRVGNKLFFDRRANSDIEYLTVSETAIEPPQDEGNSLNSPRNLSTEALFINRNFSQQVLKMGDEKHVFENPRIPFTDQSVDPTNNASVGYRYRKWDLGNGITLASRCEQDGVSVGQNGEIQYLTIRAFNEWDSSYSGGVEWRTKLDTQRSAVLATELKNNSCKLAKWTVQAILAGSDYLKFGYVSRVRNCDSTKHVILATQQFKPVEFANQINFNMDNAWGILRCVIDLCMKQPEGKYLLMKDPNMPMLRLYKLPADAFSSKSEDEGDDEDDLGPARSLGDEELLTKSVEVTQNRLAKTLTPQHIKESIEAEPTFRFLLGVVASVPDLGSEGGGGHSTITSSHQGSTDGHTGASTSHRGGGPKRRGSKHTPTKSSTMSPIGPLRRTPKPRLAAKHSVEVEEDIGDLSRTDEQRGEDSEDKDNQQRKILLHRKTSLMKQSQQGPPTKTPSHWHCEVCDKNYASKSMRVEAIKQQHEKGETHQLREEAAFLRKRVADLEQLLATRNAECQHWKQLADKHESSAADDRSQISADLKLDPAEKDGLENLLASSQLENKRLRQLVDDSRKDKQELSRLQEENSELQRSLVALDYQREKVVEEKLYERRRKEHAEANANDLKIELATVNEMLEKLEAKERSRGAEDEETEKLKHELKHANDTILQQRTQIDRLQAVSHDHQQTLDLLRQDFESKLLTIQSRLDKSQEGKSMLGDQIDRLTVQYRDLNVAYGDLSKQYEEQKAESGAVVGSNQELHRKLEALKCELAEYEEKYEKCKRDKLQAEKQLESLTNELEQLKAEHFNASASQDQSKKWHTEIVRLGKELEQSPSSPEIGRDRNSTETSIWGTEASPQDSNGSDSFVDMTDWKERQDLIVVDEDTHAMNSLVDQQRQTIEQFQERIRHLKVKVLHQLAMDNPIAVQVDHQPDTKPKGTDEKTDKCEKLNQELEKALNEKATSESQRDNVEMELKNLKEKANNLENQLTQSRSNEENLGAELSQLRSNLTSNANVVHEEYERLRGEHQRLIVEFSAAKREREDLYASFSNLQEEAEILKQEYSTSRQEMEKFGVEMEHSRQLEQDFKSYREEMDKTLAANSSNLETLVNEKQQLIVLLNEKHQENVRYHQECQRLAQLVTEEQTKIQVISRKAVQKPPAIDFQSQTDHDIDQERMGRRLQETESQLEAARLDLEHKSQLLNQLENQLESQVVEKETMVKEMERLRTHLLQIEEEAEHQFGADLEYAKNEKRKLKKQLKDQRLQLESMADQRDNALLQYEDSQIDLEKQQKALVNLQKVLQHLQHERDSKISNEVDGLKQETEVVKEQKRQLEEELGKTEKQLENLELLFDKTSPGYKKQAPSKVKKIEDLKSQINAKDNQCALIQSKLNELESKRDAKLDKDVIKNIFLGYFCAPSAEKSEVAHLLGAMLGFSDDEFKKINDEPFASPGASSSADTSQAAGSDFLRDLSKGSDTCGI